ncbi:cell envelope biogenesis protein TolA [Bradyrhizobium vignae]|uniref:Uncharacterized protein n=1 Tax=Bradyrhizobium vignae TaxID=1549949 RepID=A0A2U3PU76_9BRAD|nr:conserved protein of unknown function [Bradyrhizobium vignae]
MAAPGVVLKRPVGSDGPFGEHAELPTDLASGSSKKTGRRPPRKPAKRANDDAADRDAALAFEREQKRRERERAKEEAARQKERERWQHAVDKAQDALDAARASTKKRPLIFNNNSRFLRKARGTRKRAGKKKARLEEALRRARG